MRHLLTPTTNIKHKLKLSLSFGKRDLIVMWSVEMDDYRLLKIAQC